MLLGSNPISWCSKKKCSICPFVYEAKYHAIAFAIVDFKLDVWILHLLPQPLWWSACDNLGVTYLCANPVFHSHTKHPALNYHFVWDKIASGCFSNFPCIYFMINLFELIKPLSKKATPLCCGPRLASPMETSILRGHIRKESHPLLLKSLIGSNHLHHSINQLSIKAYYFLLSNSFNFGSPYLFLFICSL